MPSAGSGAVEETKSMGYMYCKVVILGDWNRSYMARTQATVLG